MRHVAHLLAFVVIAVLAFGSGLSVAEAAEGDVSRVPRFKLAERPYRGVTLVTVGDRVVCTGFIVAPNKVVTAAHCLVRNAAERNFRFKARLPERVRVYRAYSQATGGSPYRACGVSKVWAHSKFVKRDASDSDFGSRAHDYAVLTTKCTYPQNAIMRLWATKADSGKVRVGQTARMAGYPADSRYPGYQGMNGLNLWRTEGRVRPVGVEKRLLVTTGFVAQGMSGAPIWRTFSTNSPCGRTQCVVGVVTECAINDKGLCKKGSSDRIGVRITPTVKQAIKKH
jgi:V8-like Glu-specific endopeptidase